MSLYKVLGAYTFKSPYESWYSNNLNYSYVDINWNSLNNYDYQYNYKIILKDVNNRLFILTIKEILGEKFRVYSDDYGLYCKDSFEFELPYESSICYYTIEECTDKKLSNIRYEPLDKNQDTVFILEGADIKNHLFNVNKYGNSDKYYYNGEYRMFISSKWLKKK